MPYRQPIFLFFSLLFAVAQPSAWAQTVPPMLPYTGTIAVKDTPAFNGDGHFKFAIVNNECQTSPFTGCASFWSNDLSKTDGSEPTTAVKIPVTNGVFAAKLGDTNLGMSAIPPAVFDNTTTFLRVWFSDNGTAFEQLSPDRQLVSVPYAFRAETANSVAGSDVVGTSQLVTGAVTSEKLADAAVTSTQIADGTVGAADLAAGAVGSAQIADGTVGAADLAAGAVGSAQIADGTVGAADLAAGAVGSAQIADGTVGAADLAAGAVGSAQIADGTISGADVATSASLNIADLTTSGCITVGSEGRSICGIQFGTIGNGSPGNAGSSGTVTFPTAFPNGSILFPQGPPLIFLTVAELDGSGATAARVTAVSNTAFSWQAFSGVTPFATDQIFWVAVHPAAKAARIIIPLP